MKGIIIRKSIFTILVGLVFSVSVFADTLSYVTKQQADAAVSVLNITKRVKHFCPPCENSVVREESYTTAVAEKGTSAQVAHLWRIKINNNPIDLAYIYFPMTDGSWKNLAFYIGSKYDYIPEYLKGQNTPATTNPPPTNTNPPPTNTANLGKWTPVVEMDNQIFPSYYLATATQPRLASKLERVIGDAAGKIGMHIINPRENTRVKFAFSIDPVVGYQEFETTLKTKGDYYQIYPNVVWNWEALKRYKRPSPANAHFKLFLDGQLVDEQTVVVRIRSVNESVLAYSYYLDDDRWADTSWTFASYVNEDHEWIDQLLKEALDTRVIDSFTGYQENSEKVLRQVFAIWYVLQKRGFKYSSITKTSGSGTSEKVFSQYVRLLDDAIKASQANCVDGSVLIASVLKKLGIRVALITIPGHCFLAFDLSGKGDWKGLETTMMGNTDLALYQDEKTKINASIDGFLKAMDAGTKTLSDSYPSIKAGKPQYSFVNIDEARKNGVYPLAL